MEGIRATGRRSLGQLSLALGLAGLGWGCAEEQSGSSPGSMTVRRVVREVLLEAPAWKALHEEPGWPARLAVITPSLDLRVNGADRPAIVLPPPCSIEFEPAVWAEPGRLSVELGIDQSVLVEFSDSLANHRVEFTVVIDDREVCSQSIRLEQVGRKPGTEWSSVDCGPIERGASVRFETTFFDSRDREVEPPGLLKVGFGGVSIVTETVRSRERSSASNPNLVLIVMDTLRADRLSTYGYERPTSPNLDRLAGRGLVFEEAYATSNWTWPSTASILTGLDPATHGLVDENSAYLSERITTLAEALQDEGYTTAGWSTNYLVSAARNFDQGFETYSASIGQSDPSEVVMPDVLAWIQSQKGTRFFLYLQLIDPHAPQTPLPKGRDQLAASVPEDFSPTAINEFKRSLFSKECHDEVGVLQTDRCVSPEDQAHVSQLYDACTWSGDYWLGRVLAELELAGLTDETIVAFTSDHGEELFEHGMLTHGHTLHPEVMGVPLVLAGPGVPASERVSLAVSNRLIAGTLAELGGADLPGIDPVPALDEWRARAEEPVFYSTETGWWHGHRRTPILGVRIGDRVLHWAPRGGDWGKSAREGGQVQLFDSERDPYERVDLSEEEPDVVRRLLLCIQEQRRAAKAKRFGPPVEAGAATLESLREVGYLGED